MRAEQMIQGLMTGGLANPTGEMDFRKRDDSDQRIEEADFVVPFAPPGDCEGRFQPDQSRL